MVPKKSFVLSLKFNLKMYLYVKTERKQAPNNGYFCMAGLKEVILVIMLPYFPIQKKKEQELPFWQNRCFF